MGHACNSSCSNYFEKQIPDTGVKYTGPVIPALGICTGDYLSEVDAVILQKIFDYAHGIGISMTDPATGLPTVNLTTGSCAPLFADCISCCGTCTDLPCLLNCYKTAICTLYDDVKTIQDEIGPALTGYNTACLTGVNSSSLLNQVLQELITEFCALVTAFNVLDTTVTGFTAGIDTTIGNFLATAITSCSGVAGPNITRTGTGASTQFSFNGFVPVGAVIPYAGSQANFPGGIGTGPLCGWNLANGLNGTVNMMGQVPVGLTTMGGTLPANATGMSVTYNGQTSGEPTHLLTYSESGNPGNACTVVDNGHFHHFKFWGGGVPDRGVGLSGVVLLSGTGYGNTYMKYDGTCMSSPAPGGTSGSCGGDGVCSAYITKEFTGISVSNTAANAAAAHNNMQPSTGLLYIQRMF